MQTTDQQPEQHIKQDFGEEVSPAVQQLLRCFMQFNKAVWQQHQHMVGGCKPSEIRVLFCVKKGMGSGANEIKVSEISKMLMVTSPTVTQLLKSLEASGLIERHIDLHDRRSIGVRLTEKGHEVTRQAQQELVASLQGLIDYLGEQESGQLIESLSKVFRYFSEETKVHHSQWNGDEEA